MASPTTRPTATSYRLLLFCLAAGSADALTGLLLLCAPGLTLQLMGVRDLPADPVLLRYLGVFVAGVGVSYLYPWCLPAPRRPRLAVVLELTGLLRLGVAAFTGVAVAAGTLEPAWLLVTASDLTLALVQLGPTRRWLLAEPPATRLSSPPRTAGIAAVAATYVYFLLFAQFAFLDQLQQQLDTGGVQAAMAAMGLTGLAASAVTAWALQRGDPVTWLRRAFLLCAVTAGVAPWSHGTVALLLLSTLIGTALGMLTVTLASHLRQLLPGPRFGLGVGSGTGIAYLICNLPPLFEASVSVRSLVCALAALAGAARLPRRLAAEPRWLPEIVNASQRSARHDARDARGLAFVTLVLAFLALVWLDSAAFAIIQETPTLKAVTWGAGGRKLLLGGVHFLAAVGAGWWLDRGRLRSQLLFTFGLFLIAFSWLQGLLSGPLELAGPLYVVGISIYSTLLVAYPSLHPESSTSVPRRWRAAAVYGIGGWLGSALGVGMAQNLHRIPGTFLLAAGALLVFGALLRQPAGAAFLRAHRLTLGAGALALVFYIILPSAGVPVEAAANTTDTAVARGRQVFIQEGCLHCHSQYVRPGRDETVWGPHRPVDHQEAPPLVGARRQGPDLSNVGLRLARDELRQQLIDPRADGTPSAMPAYAYLFAHGDPQGDELVAYLSSLGVSSLGEMP